MNNIDSRDFAFYLMYILCAMPPEGDFCKIVKQRADNDAVSDLESARISGEGSFNDDMRKLVQELVSKFGDELDLGAVAEEWKKQLG